MEGMKIVEPEPYGLLRGRVGEPTTSELMRSLDQARLQIKALDAEAAGYARVCRWWIGVALAGWFLVIVLAVMLVVR